MEVAQVIVCRWEKVGEGLPHQPMLALMNWMSSRMIMSSQLAMAASTMTASHIMMGMGITSCTGHK